MEVLLAIIFIIQFATDFICIRQTKRINNEIALFSLVSHIRHKRNYVENFNYTLIRKDGESDSEYILRSRVNELFEEDLIKEKQAVKEIMQRSMKNKTVKEVDSILKSIYK